MSKLDLIILGLAAWSFLCVLMFAEGMYYGLKYLFNLWRKP